jgi:uncharacterized membrane protein YraQ (UPF0718 family)/YHS domain-containing protein
MSDVISKFGDGLGNALLMAYDVWWALVLGFAISAIVQAWIPRERIEASLGGGGGGPVSRAAVLGAASSSCSYAAVAIAKSLFQKGASAASALAFQFASTNLVIELGIVLWVLIGWQFTVAEFLGGLVLIVLMTVLLRFFVSRRLETTARDHARAAESGHQHRSAGGQMTLRDRVRSLEAWSDVAHNFRNDWTMLYREIGAGFLLAGFIALLGNGVFNSLFVSGAPSGLRTIENVVAGPVIAVLSFVCSIGNVPLAAVLWSGGISFGGVMAFIFADLIVIPIVLIYRKYYGARFALRITALMFVTMVVAALAVDGIFSLLGAIPHARPSRSSVFGHVAVDYKLFLDIIGLFAFVTLFALTFRRGATDPVCGMKVDRKKAYVSERGGRTVYLCSEHCRERYEEHVAREERQAAREEQAALGHP